MTTYIIDAAGFVTGVTSDPGAPAPNTSVPPPADAAQPLRFVDGAWMTAPAAPPSWEEAPAEYWWIDKGPFFDRFGEKALSIVSSSDSVVQGAITLATVRQYIDLKRPDLPQMLALLVSKSLITAPEAAAVLSATTTDYERHIKGLPQPGA